MGARDPRRWLRVGLLALIEVVALAALLVLAAQLIPLVAPPPTAPTPVIPVEAARDCPPLVAACR